jgi:hypothetical protein
VTPFQTTLGPYDFWAVEYAYRPLAPESEAAELARIAARSREAELAYGTDEDNFLGIDPDSLQMDLGSDPLAYARKRLGIARDLFARQEVRELAPDQDFGVLRRSLNYAVNDTARAVGILVRQIGGVRTLRDFPGAGRDPLQPVPAPAQREALDLIARGLFASDSFRVSPALQRRLAPDFQERDDAVFRGGEPVATDYSPTQRLLVVQRAVLGQLTSDTVAARILDSQGKAAAGVASFQLTELYGRLDREIWSELAAGGDVPAARRELQRDHLNRLAERLLRPGTASRADIRSLLRVQAQSLLQRLTAATQRKGWSADVRAHLQDCVDTLSQALGAKVQRQGA